MCCYCCCLFVCLFVCCLCLFVVGLFFVFVFLGVVVFCLCLFLNKNNISYLKRLPNFSKRIEYCIWRYLPLLKHV